MMVAISVMIVIVVPITVATVVLPGMVVTISVAASMFWSPPVAFPIVPALGTMFVTWDDPACAFVWRTPVVTGHPPIVAALGRPEASHPYK